MILVIAVFAGRAASRNDVALFPSEPFQDTATHHPFLVRVRKKIERLGEMRDPLPICRLMI
jgi:hypothetical protein